MARKKAHKKQETTLMPHRAQNLRALLQQAETGDCAAAMRAYLDAGGSVVRSTNSGAAPNIKHMPIVHNMAYRNAHPHTEVAESMRLLIAAGADINIKAGPEHDARTAMMLACERDCCTKVLQVFLENGADVSL
jgi:Ankyrin repeat